MNAGGFGGAAAILLLGSVAGAATLLTQEDFTAANVRGAFLLRDAGARSAGLGGAFTAIADEPSAIATNPAGVGQLDGFGVSASYDGAGNGLGVSDLAAAYPVGKGVVAARVALVSWGEYDARDDLGAALGMTGLADVSTAVGYSRPNPEWLGLRGTWGAAVAASTDTAGEALVLGAHLGWLAHFTNDLSAGVAVRNAGPVPAGSAPMTAVAGGAWTFPDRVGRVSVDAGFGIGDGLTRVAGGLELPALARPGEAGHRSPLAIRLGYRGEVGAKSRGGADGISAGLGMRKGRWQVDLAFQSYGDLGGGVRAGVAWQNRSEILGGR